MESIRRAIWHVRYSFDPIPRAISHLRRRSARPIRRAIWRLRYSFDPTRRAIWRLRYSFRPIRRVISHLGYSFRPIRRLISHLGYSFRPIRRAVSRLQRRYVGRHSVGGIVAFALSVTMSIGLVAFGIANMPATPGLPADVSRPVVYPTGGIPVPGPSMGPSTQNG